VQFHELDHRRVVTPFDFIGSDQQRLEKAFSVAGQNGYVVDLCGADYKQIRPLVFSSQNSLTPKSIRADGARFIAHAPMPFQVHLDRTNASYGPEFRFQINGLHLYGEGLVDRPLYIKGLWDSMIDVLVKDGIENNILIECEEGFGVYKNHFVFRSRDCLNGAGIKAVSLDDSPRNNGNLWDVRSWNSQGTSTGAHPGIDLHFVQGSFTRVMCEGHGGPAVKIRETRDISILGGYSESNAFFMDVDTTARGVKTLGGRFIEEVNFNGLPEPVGWVYMPTNKNASHERPLTIQGVAQ